MDTQTSVEQAKRRVISTGNAELDGKIGGGIPANSLTLIEGSSGAGKSVLTQQIMWGSLRDGFRLSLFTSENTVTSLVTQMASLDLDVLDYVLLGRLCIFPMELSHLMARAPQTLLDAMRCETDNDVIIVDSLTSVIAHATIEEVTRFFETCKRLSSDGTTIIIVMHTHAASGMLASSVRSLCDAHLQLRTEQDGQRLVKTLEVAKVRGAVGITGSIVSFEVEPGWGMRVVPISKARG